MLELYVLEGGRFSFFVENWYVGPLFGNIGKKNNVLENVLKILFLFDLI